MAIYFFGSVAVLMVVVYLGSKHLNRHPRQVGTHLSVPSLAFIAVTALLAVNMLVSAILYLSTK